MKMSQAWIFLSLGAVLGLAVPSSTAPPAERITEISLERTPCFGSCPVDKVVLRADGTAAYTGTRFVERLGEFRGTLSTRDFQRLAGLLTSQRFFNLRNRYASRATDLPSRITSAVRSGTRKAVTNYGDAGPINLWTVEVAVLGVAAEIRWEKAGAAKGQGRAQVRAARTGVARRVEDTTPARGPR